MGDLKEFSVVENGWRWIVFQWTNCFPSDSIDHSHLVQLEGALIAA